MSQMRVAAKDTSGRQLTIGTWKNFNPDLALTDPDYGSFEFWDFRKPKVTGEWTETQAVSGTFAITADQYGLATLDSGATTDTQGIQIQLANSNILLASNSIVYFEVRGKFSANTTGPEFFAGLHETDTGIIGSGALDDKNYVGFFSASGNTNAFVNRVTSTAQATQSAGSLPAAGTYTRLGFRVENAARIYGYVDGVELSTIQTSSIATALLRPSFVCQSNGTTQPTFAIDWVAVGQKFVA